MIHTVIELDTFECHLELYMVFSYFFFASDICIIIVRYSYFQNSRYAVTKKKEINYVYLNALKTLER